MADPTLSIDIIAGTLFGSLLKDSSSAIASSFMCIVKFNGKEIGRTEPSADSHDPAWLTRISIPIEGAFDSKQPENNRPFFFEFLEVWLYDLARSQTDRIAECRIPLVDIGTNKWYKLVKPIGNSGMVDLESSARLQISIEITGEINSFFYSSDPRQLTLTEVFPPQQPHCRHLYMDLGGDWNPSQLLGSLMLPGPRLGEVIEDMHPNVEWKVVTGSNCFGDKYYIQCVGFLIVTDIRVIYLPQEIQSPVWTSDVSVKKSSDNPLTSEELLAIRRMTYQVPVSAIQDCFVSNIDMNSTMITIESRDGFRGEFVVKRPPQGHRRPAVGTHNRSATAHTNTGSSGSRGNSGIARRRESRLAFNTSLSKPPLLPVPLNFFSGLETYCVSPNIWCGRAMDVILFMIREDRCWIKWAQYMKLTCDDFQHRMGEKEVVSGNKSSGVVSCAWVRKAKQRISEEDEYRRLRVQDGEWVISDVNCSYQLCATYPQTLVVPGGLSEEDIRIAALERSRGRLCVLTWLHPISKVPLCRSAQPNAGMSGSNEGDKKACIAIKNSCPTGLPLRIADARPKLNANANSLQGKGFENVAFFGGPSVASINFLDIENIHVMRSSLNKLREGWFSSAANSTSTDSEYVQSSRWLYHVSTLLRGAVGMAESIILGYPVLVHCSDGWDRTSQLSALTQILLDPYYRTIDGFFSLVSKDWCAFGHKFEFRCNRSSSFKESSPTFLQFLDALWQIMEQFPASFEYTSQFLVIFAQACYSGLFSSFRGDSEDERNSMMRRTAPLEDMSLSEMQYTTIFFYVYVLLRSEAFSSILLNPFFQPPSAANSSNLYLRIRTSIVDLALWKEGLAGFNKQIFEVSLGPQCLNRGECIAISSNINSRFAGYLNLHMKHLDESVRNRLDVITASGPMSSRTVLPYFQSKLLSNNSYPVQYRQTFIEGSFVGSFENEDDNISNTNILTFATSRIQLWYRALVASRVALVSWPIPSHYEHLRPTNGTPSGLSGLRGVLYIIALTETKVAFSLRQSIVAIKITQIHEIIDEVVEEALIRCMRFEAAQRCIMNDTMSYQSQTPDRVERRSAMDNSFVSPSSSSYVSGSLKSMAAMAGGLKSMVTETVTGSSSSNAVRPNSSSDRLYVSTRDSEISTSSPSSGSSKKTLSKKLFTMMTGGMLEKDRIKDKGKDLGKEISFEEASV